MSEVPKIAIKIRLFFSQFLELLEEELNKCFIDKLWVFIIFINPFVLFRVLLCCWFISYFESCGDNGQWIAEYLKHVGILYLYFLNWCLFIRIAHHKRIYCHNCLQLRLRRRAQFLNALQYFSTFIRQYLCFDIWVCWGLFFPKDYGDRNSNWS